MKKQPSIALGTWSWGKGMAGGDQVFGNNVGVDELRPVFDEAMKNGLNLWDSAVVYGMGDSETILSSFTKGCKRGETYNPMLPQIEKLVTVMRGIGEKYGVSPAQVALAWAIAKGTTPIIGVTKVSQVQDALKAMRISLTAEEISQMETAAEETGVDTRGSWEMPMI